MSFDDDLNALTEPDWADVDVLLNGTLYALRFTQMDAHKWADACDLAPMREDTAFDKKYGYDLRALCEIVAPECGALITADGTEPLAEDQWRTLWSRIDGAAFQRVGEIIFALNFYGPREAVVRAKKALTATAATSSSRSVSASPRNGSGVGSRKKSPSTSTTTPAESSAP